jgi:CubicO group peptidase (beta-lactamase class C family)
MKTISGMKRALILFQILILIGCKSTIGEQDRQETVTPESLGIPSEAILDFIREAERERKDELHSFILMRHGKVAAEGYWNPYNAESPHMLYSLSKSFTSTAIGLAQAEGMLTIDDRVISFFPDETPQNPSGNLRAMRIRDLLKMNSGHNEDASGRMQQDRESWVRGFLSLPVEHKPGTHFVYNSGASFMLSAIVQKVTGETLLQYLTPRLFEPLGIDQPTWESNMNGINMGGWGLKIRTRDIVHFGQLYLQEGQWNGQQLIPVSWVKEATSYQTSNGSNPNSDWEQGYGYQFWRCRHNVYRGDGAFGQYCIVMPGQDAVMAITSGTRDMQAILNLVWNHLLPAMQEGPLEENEAAYKSLQDKLGTLSLSVVKGGKTSTEVKNISGQWYKLKPNSEGISEISFNLSGNENTVTIKKADGTFTIPIGTDSLKKGTFVFPRLGEQVIASSGAWTSPVIFQMRTYLYETPYYFNYKFTFGLDEVTIDQSMNVSFGQAGLPPIRGKLVEEGKKFSG